MDVFFDSQGLGQVTNAKSLNALLDDEQQTQIVCTRVDGVDTTFDDLLEQVEWSGERLDLYTFDGWLEESASQVEQRLIKLRVLASNMAVMSGEQSPIELLDELMDQPKAIIAELLLIREHLDESLSATLLDVSSLMSGAETEVTLAVRSRDFVRLADTIRLEWHIALSALKSFLSPGSDFEFPPCDAPQALSADDLFKVNIGALKERFPDLVSQIIAAWNSRDKDRYAIDTGPSGLRAPRVNGQRMWSIIEPIADLERIAKEYRDEAVLDHWDSAATWGVSGEHAFALLNEEMEQRPHIYVRIDLEAFALELHCVSWVELLASDNTLLSTTVNDYRWTLRSCFVHQDRVRRLSSPNLLQVDPSMYVELHEESGHTELALLLENRTGESRGRQWTTNALDNVWTLLKEPHAGQLKDLRKGLPGLLVAPGPSLRKNIHLIPEFAKKGVVVGVSHVLGKLQDLGVNPELTVAIEANDISSHFDNTDPTKTSLFLHESTHPNVVEQDVAQCWVVHDGAIGRRLRNDNKIGSLNMLASSCTHVAMWALKEMGCDPIVFVGLDLALEDGKQYSDGCEGWTPTQLSIEVEGYYGDKVQTLAQYNVFRDQFELCLAHETFSGPRFINSTEGGAKIRGLEQKALADVISELADLPDKAEVGALVAPLEFLPEIDWAEAAQSLEDSAEQMIEAEKSAKQGLQAAKLAYKCFKLGDEAGIGRRGRAAAKRSNRANEILIEDDVLSGRWMAAQNKRSERSEREATYLEDNPKALMRHNLMHYQQLLASIEEAAGSLRPLYEAAAKKVREKHNV